MRRIASVFMPSKRDDDGHTKRSWKSWLGRRPLRTHRPDHNDIDNDTSTIPLDTLIPFTRQSLIIPPPLPPFAPLSLFPRSVSDPRVLTRPPSLRIHVLKSAILHRDASFKQNELPSSVSDFPNISRPPVPYPSSPGIRRWLSRPCFEDRNVVYAPVDSAISISQVSASLPVAAIEYSDYLEFMADPNSFLQPVTGMLFLDSPSSISFITFIVHPLPLPPRNEHLPPPSLSIKSDSPPMSPPATTVKRVVRFAADDDQDDDDDDDDGVPLHIIRQRKLREQKAKFIRQERQRRAREEEFNRRQREKEALEKEREHAILEDERANAEKERKQKEQAILAEEVVKTRLRRELHRAGGVPALVMRDRENGLDFGVVSSSTPAAGERNKTHHSASSSTASLRGVQASTTSTNPWRDSSVDPHLQPQHQQAASDSSPASSRRSSILSPTNNTPSPLYQSHFNSRPPSSYSSSSESIGKRNSLMPFMGSPAMGIMSPMAMQMNMMSMPTYAVPQPIIMSYPPFASSNPNISSNPSQAIPPFVPVNSFIDYNNLMPNDIDMQMPLLPPTAPFMKQPSYERRKNSEQEGGERNPRPASLRSSSGSKRDSNGSFSERRVSVPEREGERQSFSTTIPRTGKLSELGASVGARKPISGQGHSQQRSSSGPVTEPNLRRQGQPIRASTMPVPPPVPSPWTGVPTAQQRQLQAQLAMSNGPSKSGTGQSVSGTSSSTVTMTKRASIMSGIGIGKSMGKGKPSVNSNQGRSHAITW